MHASNSHSPTVVMVLVKKRKKASGLEETAVFTSLQCDDVLVELGEPLSPSLRDKHDYYSPSLSQFQEPCCTFAVERYSEKEVFPLLTSAVP